MSATPKTDKFRHKYAGKKVSSAECGELYDLASELEFKLTEVTEALRKAIVWAESVSHRITDKKDINWTYLNEARATLEATQKGDVK